MYDLPERGALSSSSFPKEIRRMELGEDGRDSHSDQTVRLLNQRPNPLHGMSYCQIPSICHFVPERHSLQISSLSVYTLIPNGSWFSTLTPHFRKYFPSIWSGCLNPVVRRSVIINDGPEYSVSFPKALDVPAGVPSGIESSWTLSIWFDRSVLWTVGCSIGELEESSGTVLPALEEGSPLESATTSVCEFALLMDSCELSAAAGGVEDDDAIICPFSGVWTASRCEESVISAGPELAGAVSGTSLEAMQTTPCPHSFIQAPWREPRCLNEWRMSSDRRR